VLVVCYLFYAPLNNSPWSFISPAFLALEPGFTLVLLLAPKRLQSIAEKWVISPYWISHSVYSLNAFCRNGGQYRSTQLNLRAYL